MALIVALFPFMRYRPEQGDRVAKPRGFLAATYRLSIAGR